MHFDFENTVAVASLTATALNVKAETVCGVSAHFRVLSLRKKFAYIGENARVSCGI